MLFAFNLLSEFQRATDPALKSYKQPATLRFGVFTCGAILGRSGHHLVLHKSKNWGGYSKRKPLFHNLLHGLHQLLRNSLLRSKLRPDFIHFLAQLRNLGLSEPGFA